MGMFDYIQCKRHLPVPGFEGREFQTKDTPDQGFSRYEIREDGSLWRKEYEQTEWEEQFFTGEVRFYDSFKDGEGWIEFSAYFVRGMLKELHPILMETVDTSETT
jgi:hypothetical protein